jgi:hypothetical protein
MNLSGRIKISLQDSQVCRIVKQEAWNYGDFVLMDVSEKNKNNKHEYMGVGITPLICWKIVLRSSRKARRK